MSWPSIPVRSAACALGGVLDEANINEAKRALAEELQARWSDPESAMIAEVEIRRTCPECWRSLASSRLLS